MKTTQHSKFIIQFFENSKHNLPIKNFAEFFFLFLEKFDAVGVDDAEENKKVLF